MRIIAKRKVADTAKILIVISITLLVYGIVLYYVDNHKLIDPIKDVENIDTDSSVISITTSDGSEIVPINDKKNKNNKSNSTSNTNNREQSDIVTNLDRENALLKSTIEKDYSIKILYGNEVKDSSVAGVGIVPITDSEIINKKLKELSEVLDLYPDTIFKEIKNGGIPLKILFINNFSEESITGITDSSYDYANIYIAVIYDFRESFFHESYHYIERYMLKKGVNFNSWDSLNPKDFSWGTIDGSLSYSNTFSENSYFVNNYAQTSDTEDRASTFEYMMAQTKASCLNKNKPVWDKANYMAMTMEATLTSVNADTVEYWERFIKD